VKLKIYRYTGGFVRDAGKRIQAVQVINTTSWTAAAKAFGCSTYELRQFGTKVEAVVLPKGQLFTLGGPPWLGDITIHLAEHPDVIYWHPLDAHGQITWRIGFDGSDCVP
jgi:hypothetical protein